MWNFDRIRFISISKLSYLEIVKAICLFLKLNCSEIQFFISIQLLIFSEKEGRDKQWSDCLQAIKY